MSSEIPQPQQQILESNISEDKSQTSTPATPATPASAIDGGREISNRILYVGNIPKSASEEMLRDLFSISNPIKGIKILNDKNKLGFNYCFIEYDLPKDAEVGFQSLNGKVINDSEIRINWAYQSATITTNSTNKEEPIYNIFVGDLSPEVNDEGLKNAFQKFESLKQAHVMWDMQTSRSRGYGFVTFDKLEDAELALQTMNGEWLGGRAIRCNWASHKQINNGKTPRQRQFKQQQQQQQQQQTNGNNTTSPIINGNSNNNTNGNNQLPVMSPQSYDIVLRQTPSWQTTVYLGNIAHFTQQQELLPLLQNFGYIVDFKFHPERGCAFVKYDTHERAALAIIQLAGFNLNGRPLKCGWGKDRPPQFQNFRNIQQQQQQPMYK
ncbi:unnamed protein product [Candida verbasci]|uniref:RRM domain-containing protein n=1 Tax=Candida verbasci TaxID=1227364 RepID=A0A9W4TVX5_9ASCO|nr:unnamed protein product [Candida verbasci]